MPDSTEYISSASQGLKWSDGQPYTTADVKFWYDTILTDKRVAVNGQRHRGRWQAGEAIEIVDEMQTFKKLSLRETLTVCSRCSSPAAYSDAHDALPPCIISGNHIQHR